jgi:hypothetical protein
LEVNSLKPRAHQAAVSLEVNSPKLRQHQVEAFSEVSNLRPRPHLAEVCMVANKFELKHSNLCRDQAYWAVNRRRNNSRRF